MLPGLQDSSDDEEDINSDANSTEHESSAHHDLLSEDNDEGDNDEENSTHELSYQDENTGKNITSSDHNNTSLFFFTYNKYDNHIAF